MQVVPLLPCCQISRPVRRPAGWRFGPCVWRRCRALGDVPGMRPWSPDSSTEDQAGTVQTPRTNHSMWHQVGWCGANPGARGQYRALGLDLGMQEWYQAPEPNPSTQRNLNYIVYNASKRASLQSSEKFVTKIDREAKLREWMIIGTSLRRQKAYYHIK